MERIYKPKYVEFDFNNEYYPFDVNELKSITFKFYTTDEGNYLIKTESDIIDGILTLPWIELKNLNEGVLLYDYNAESDHKFYDRHVTTNYFIVSGRGTSEPRDGEDGTTFIPEVSPTGDLSWSNEDGKPNPKTVNIKGPKGDVGNIENFIPTEGKDGQLLTKIGNDGFDLGWIDRDRIDKVFTFNQRNASDLWEIKHDLNKYPSVTVVDSGGSTMIGEVEYVDKNKLTIKFSYQFAGKAYLN